MITNLHIKNFKCHEDTNLSLGNLTLLCGQNGVGKSSVNQSLLLLRQSYDKNMLPKALSLNAPLCYLGEGKDVIHRYPPQDVFDEAYPLQQFDFVLTINNLEYHWSFNTEDNLNSDFLPSSFSPIVVFPYLDYADYRNGNISLFNKNFQYISASRGIDYKRSDYEVEIQKKISVEEGKAELVAQFLHKYQNELVLPEILHSLEKDNTLLAQTTAWEREISKGIKVIPKNEGGTYTIRYSYEGLEQEFSAKNVGFGISYSLPVIVAILASKKDALLLIENPEAHLHPYGQAKLAELMCIAAQAGIQIIVETHSDHIVNGVLVQCKRFEQESQGINRENVKIHYFEKTEDNTACRATEVEVKKGGKIKNAPVGFFDQIEKDMQTIMGF